MRSCLVALCAGLVLAMPAMAKKKPSLRPRGIEASFIESYSPTEVTIKASGIGDEPEDAHSDVPKVALQFVLTGGTDPLLSNAQEKAKAEQVLDQIFTEQGKYITWVADKVTSTKKNPDKTYEVTKMVRVNKGALSEFLSKRGIVVSRAELAASLGNPIIMVLPESPKGQNPIEVFDRNPLASQCAGAIESYLTARMYDVQAPRAAEQINTALEMTSQVKGAEEDMAYQIALALGSDIYVTFSGEVQAVPTGGRKASLVVKAYETTTARLLGTESGYSQTRPNTSDQVLVEEATNDAIEKVLNRVNNYWKSDIARGLQYKVVLKIKDDLGADRTTQIADAVEDVLSDNFKDYKETINTGRTMDYLIWAPRDEFKNARAVSRVFRNKLELPGLKVREMVTNKKLLVLEIGG